MPVVGQRDPAVVKPALEGWLAERVGTDDVEITDLVIPQSSGFSNETFLLTASWAGQAEPARLVLRSQPQTNLLFPEIDLIEQQYLSMKLLGEHSNVPVAKVLWAEPGTAILGQPFFVMERLDGLVPGDVPPYTTAGFVFDMTPEVRHEWNLNAVEAMSRVGRVDWQAAGFQHLDKKHHGALGPEQRQGYFRHFLEWATAGQRHPVAHPAYERLMAMWPDDGEHVELSWGDARPGNQMFQGTEVIGVFDWEMVSLGNSESDLGWWLFLQKFSTEGSAAQLLDGMLSREETIAEWERHAGRPAKHVDFYEALGGFHFTLVYIRITDVMGVPEHSLDNPVALLTCDLLGLPKP